MLGRWLNLRRSGFRWELGNSQGAEKQMWYRSRQAGVIYSGDRVVKVMTKVEELHELQWKHVKRPLGAGKCVR